MLHRMVTICAVAACLSSPLQAQEKTARPQQPQGAWVVNCVSGGQQKALNCKASQTIVLKDSKQFLMSVSLQVEPGAKRPALLMHLPHGIFLPAQAEIQIDQQKPIQIAIQTCDVKGCYAGHAVDDALLKALQTGATLTAVFQNLKKEKIGVPISLNGLAPALAKIMS